MRMRAALCCARLAGGVRWVLPALLAGMVWAGSATAQDDITPDEYADYLRETIRSLLTSYYDGETDAALEQAIALDAEVDQYEDFMEGHPAFWWPDIVVARLLHEEKRHADVIDKVAPLIAEFDASDPRHTSVRFEALMRLGRGLFLDGRYAAAETVLRQYMRDVAGVDPDAGVDPKWETMVGYMLARTATGLGAADAGALRAAFLTDFWDRAGADEFMYLYMTYSDLNARNAAEPPDADVLPDARAILDYLTASDTATMDRYQDLYGLVTRILSEHGDYAAALPLAEARLAFLTRTDPEGADRFWAWQNLAGLHRNRGAYAQSISIAQDALDAIAALTPDPDGATPMPRQRGALHAVMGAAAYFMDSPEMYQRALQDSYVAYREILPPSDETVQGIGARIERKYVDPTTFQYATELGVADSGSIQITADAHGVIAFVWAGRARRVDVLLKQLEGSNDIPPVVVAINRVWYHALMGEVDKGLSTLRTVRQMARNDPSGPVPPNGYGIDLAEALLMNYARLHSRPGVGNALARLERRTDLPPLEAAIVRMLRMNLLANANEFSQAQVLYDQYFDADRGLVDTSAMGTTLGLGLLNVALELRDLPKARDVFSDLEVVFEGVDHRLARTVSQLFMLNADGAAIATEEGFVQLAFLLRDLRQMLPDSHQWSVASRVAYAGALGPRGEYQSAVDIYVQALKDYRESPAHRADVAGFLQTEMAMLRWQMGQTDVATTIAAQVASDIDLDTWRGSYWVRIAAIYVFALREGWRLDEAAAFLNEAALNTRAIDRLDPGLRMEWHTMVGDIAFMQDRAEDATAAYDLAVAALPFDELDDGMPMANVLMRRAYNHQYWGRLNAAFDDIKRGNRLWFDRYDLIAAGENDVTRMAEHDFFRILAEAEIGWDFAQELKQAQTAPQ